jgi:hypothetical protein
MRGHVKAFVTCSMMLGLTSFGAGVASAAELQPKVGGRAPISLPHDGLRTHASEVDSDLQSVGYDPRQKCSGTDTREEPRPRRKSEFRRLFERNVTVSVDHGRDQVLALA